MVEEDVSAEVNPAPFTQYYTKSVFGVNMLYYRNDFSYLDYEFEDVLKLFFLKDELQKADGPRDYGSGAFLFCGFETAAPSLCISLKSRGFQEKASIPVPEGFTVLFQGQRPESQGNMKESGPDIKSFKKVFKRKLYLLLKSFTGKSSPWGVMTGIRPAKLVNELMDAGAGEQDIVNKLVEDYYVAGSKAQLLYEVAGNQRELFKDSAPENVSLYLGIPFCPTRCLYCSFSSSTIGQYKKQVDSYLDALLKEIRHTGELLSSCGLKIESIYIGGGTPTSINSLQLSRLLEGLESLLDLSSMKEYTLEAGRPDTIDAGKLKVIKDSRVTRISINPQSMNATTLERIGRGHTPQKVEEAFYNARSLGFDNINMDVICGLPGEDAVMFKNSMEQLSRMKPDSVTVHTMAVKRASRLNLERDNFSLHKEYDQVAEMVETAGAYAAELGLKPYYLYRQKNILGNLENVGYSKKGKECLYNIQIMEERQSVFACGAGAVTKVVFPGNRLERSFNVKSVEEYLGRIDEMLERKKILIANWL